MELEVGITKKDLIGMFIRTDEKGIGKATYGDGGKYDLNIDATFYKCHNIKYSHNIIDLIEVRDIITIELYYGDYDDYIKTTTFMVASFVKDENNTIKLYDEDGTWINNHSYKIKSIVTHEQFDSVKYEVKGDE